MLNRQIALTKQLLAISLFAIAGSASLVYAAAFGSPFSVSGEHANQEAGTCFGSGHLVTRTPPPGSHTRRLGTAGLRASHVVVAV